MTDTPKLSWTKSTHTVEKTCVEWAITPRAVHVRNSNDPNGPRLIFTHQEWTAFTQGMRDGQGQLPT